MIVYLLSCRGVRSWGKEIPLRACDGKYTPILRSFELGTLSHEVLVHGNLQARGKACTTEESTF